MKKITKEYVNIRFLRVSSNKILLSIFRGIDKYFIRKYYKYINV